MPTLNGTEGDDFIFVPGENADDTITTLGGNDRIITSGGFDTISAGSGDDQLESSYSTTQGYNVDMGDGSDLVFVSNFLNSSFNLGTGDDWAQLRPANGVVDTITLGAGRDHVLTSFQDGGTQLFTDFQAGAGGDVLQFSTWYWKNATWWFDFEGLPNSGISNPFAAGFARLVDSAGGALLQVRSSTTAAWSTIATFQGTTASQFHADNFLGWSPTGAAAPSTVLNITEASSMWKTWDTYGDDTIYGTSGGGYIILSHGADVVYAGDGNDEVLSGGVSSGYKILYGEGGNDTLGVAGGMPFGSGVFGLPTGSTMWGLVHGGDGDDSIGGGWGDDELYGDAGNDFMGGGGGGEDFMSGGDGNDRLWSGSGNQRLYGDAGNDELLGGSEDDLLDGGADQDHLKGENGNDTLLGGGGADTLEGGAGHDTLDGGAGVDQMFGGGGNDKYRVNDGGDRVYETAGEGTDTVYASVSYGLRAGVEVETLRTSSDAGTAAINLTGNEFAQTIVGNAGANTINGGGGNDKLDGGAGIDKLYGGLGDDIYYVDTSSDRPVEVADQGTDTVVASANVQLRAGTSIEFLRTSNENATTAINLTGNEFAQSITGNAGANTINGGGGDDALYGGLGNDRLYGGTGNDTIDGGTTNDRMVGGAGDDKYRVDNVGDKVTETVGEGTDTVYATVSYTLNTGSEVESLRTSNEAATTAINFTGNEYAQTLVGNAGINVLNGGPGNDTLYGRGGADRFVFSSLGDTDHIGDFLSGTDQIDLRALDANAGIAGDQAFAFIGDSAFGSVAGQLRTYVSDGVRYLAADINGDGVADFTIGLGSANVVAGDFLL